MRDVYKKLRTKYKLPSYNELNNHFELDYIEEDAFLIRSVRRRIHEKVVFFAKLFEKVLFPNQTILMEMYETKFFTEKEKEDLFKVYDLVCIFAPSTPFFFIMTLHMVSIRYPSTDSADSGSVANTTSTERDNRKRFTVVTSSKSPRDSNSGPLPLVSIGEP